MERLKSFLKGAAIVVTVFIMFLIIGGFVAVVIDSNTKTQTTSRTTFAPTRAPITIDLPQMPQEYSYTPVTRVTAKYKLTDIRTEIKKYFDGYTIVLYVSGEKTYDIDGASGTHAGHIRYKLYDQDGYVQETGTIYMDDYSVGDKFRDKEEYIYSVPAGHYRLELMDYR